MPPQLQQFLQNRQLLLIAGGVLVLLIVLVVALFVFGGKKKTEADIRNEEMRKPLKEEQLVLATTDNAGKAIEIQALLARQGIASDRSQEGQNIQVRLMEGATLETRDQALITLVQSGLMDNNVGLEAFDKSDMTASREDKKIKLLRAQQGELSRLIRKIHPIQDAYVQLSMGQQSIFKQDERPMSASVQVVLPPNERLTHDKVRAIINLMVGAVQGLTANHVALSDTNGNTYNSVLDAVTDHVTMLEEQDAYMKSKVSSQLDKLIGSGHYVVTVSTHLRTANRETMVERYHPGHSTVQTEQRFEERMGGPVTPPGQAGGAVSTYLPPELAPPPDEQTIGSGKNLKLDGVPFASIPNTPGATKLPGPESTEVVTTQDGGQMVVTTTPTAQGYERKGADLMYQNSRTQYVESAPPGTLEEISIAVTLDQDHLPPALTMTEIKQVLARAASPKARPENVSVAVVDFDHQRGDSTGHNDKKTSGDSGSDWQSMLTNALLMIPSNWWAIAGVTAVVLLLLLIIGNALFPKPVQVLPPSADPQFNQAQQEFFQFREETSRQQTEVAESLTQMQQRMQQQMQQQTQQLLQEQTRQLSRLQEQLVEQERANRQQQEALQQLAQQQRDELERLRQDPGPPRTGERRRTPSMAGLPQTAPEDPSAQSIRDMLSQLQADSLEEQDLLPEDLTPTAPGGPDPGALLPGGGTTPARRRRVRGGLES